MSSRIPREYTKDSIGYTELSFEKQKTFRDYINGDKSKKDEYIHIARAEVDNRLERVLKEHKSNRKHFPGRNA